MPVQATIWMPVRSRDLAHEGDVAAAEHGGGLDDRFDAVRLGPSTCSSAVGELGVAS